MSNASPIEILAATSPEAAEAFGQLRTAAIAELDPTTRELVVVASLAAKGQLGSLGVHARRALRDGVPVATLRRGVLATLGASTVLGEVVAALRTIDEVAAEVGAVASPAVAPPESTDAGSSRPASTIAWSEPIAPSQAVDEPLSATLYAPGQPNAVVLLHSLALDRRIWWPMVDSLATRLSVLACDLPGHGRSPAAPKPSVEAMADQVAATIAAAGLASVGVVGLSLGGSVAQALAVRHPDTVRALALLDTSSYYGPGAAASWAQRAEEARGQGLASLSGFQLERWFSDDFRERRSDLCAAILDLFARTDLDGYADACTALGAMDLRAQIASITCPAVVVVGEHDSATPLSHAEEIHRQLPHSALRVLSGCKHLSAVERPAAVLALVADLLGA